MHVLPGRPGQVSQDVGANLVYTVKLSVKTNSSKQKAQANKHQTPLLPASWCSLTTLGTPLLAVS